MDFNFAKNFSLFKGLLSLHYFWLLVLLVYQKDRSICMYIFAIIFEDSSKCTYVDQYKVGSPSYWHSFFQTFVLDACKAVDINFFLLL